MLEFPKLALKSLAFVMSYLHINIRLHNYGINDVSKHVNIASKRVNIARVNVTSRKYFIMRP